MRQRTPRIPSKTCYMVKAESSMSPMLSVKKLLVALSCFSVLLIGGCKEPIYHQLGEREANNVLLTLLKGGVEADKRDDGEKGYSVWVDDAKMALAIELLKANAQPEDSYRSMGDLFARNQLIATPTEERVRFVFGIEQALSATLAKIDGVLVS